MSAMTTTVSSARSDETASWTVLDSEGSIVRQGHVLMSCLSEAAEARITVTTRNYTAAYIYNMSQTISLSARRQHHLMNASEN
jgi:hypothetical protein